MHSHWSSFRGNASLQRHLEGIADSTRGRRRSARRTKRLWRVFVITTTGCRLSSIRIACLGCLHLACNNDADDGEALMPKTGKDDQQERKLIKQDVQDQAWGLDRYVPMVAFCLGHRWPNASSLAGRPIRSANSHPSPTPYPFLSKELLDLAERSSWILALEIPAVEG